MTVNTEKSETCTRDEARDLVVREEGQRAFDRFLADFGDRSQYSQIDVVKWLGYVECRVVGDTLLQPVS